jgi:hypothetical protein
MQGVFDPLCATKPKYVCWLSIEDGTQTLFVRRDRSKMSETQRTLDSCGLLCRRVLEKHASTNNKPSDKPQDLLYDDDFLSSQKEYPCAVILCPELISSGDFCHFHSTRCRAKSCKNRTMPSFLLCDCHFEIIQNKRLKFEGDANSHLLNK